MNKWQICVGGDNGSASQIAYDHITHLEPIERTLKEEWCTLNTQKTTKQYKTNNTTN